MHRKYICGDEMVATGVSDLLTASEAAMVSAVSVRDVNRVIDEDILPGEFVRAGDGRHVAAAGCPLIAFYFATAKQLTSEQRLWAIRRAAPRLRKAASAAALLKQDWTFRDDFLTIDLAPFLRDTSDRLNRLLAARTLVATSPDVLSGTPVIRGTRIPVHDVAASLEAGIPLQRILAAYPALDADKVRLAAIYAQANPPRGRPRRVPLPKGATVISDRRLSRRRKAG
jgi:uncharacterized protein (DUF433 family)